MFCGPKDHIVAAEVQLNLPTWFIVRMAQPHVGRETCCSFPTTKPEYNALWALHDGMRIVCHKLFTFRLVAFSISACGIVQR